MYVKIANSYQLLQYKSTHACPLASNLNVGMSSPTSFVGSSKRRRLDYSDAAPRSCPPDTCIASTEHKEVAGKKSVMFSSQSDNNSSDDNDNEVTTWNNVDRSQIWYTEEEIAAMKSTARRASLHFRSRDDHRRANRQSIEDEFEEPLPSVLSALDRAATEREMLIMKAMLARQVRRDRKELDESSSLPVEDGPNSTDERTCSNDNNSAALPKSCIPRGLEQRVSFRRQWKKFQTVRCVLECQRVLREEGQSQEKSAERAATGQKRSFGPYPALAEPNNITDDLIERTPKSLNNEEDMPTKLARASSKCSQWARDIALATGQTDMLEVYPEMAAFVFSRQAQTTPSPPPQVVPAGVPGHAPENKHKHTCTSYTNAKKECVAQPILTRDTSAQASIVSLGEDDDAAPAGSTTSNKDSAIDLELEDVTAAAYPTTTITEPEDYNIGAAAADINSSNSEGGAHTTRAAANEMTDFLNSSYSALF